jgi:hypothetical protein
MVRKATIFEKALCVDSMMGLMESFFFGSVSFLFLNPPLFSGQWRWMCDAPIFCSLFVERDGPYSLRGGCLVIDGDD